MSIFDMMGAFNPQHTKMPIEMTAIWLNKSVMTGTGEIKKRIEPGDLLRIENDDIVDCKDGNWTHRVIGTQGYIDNSELWFILSDRNDSTNIKIVP